jgi:glycosyltransferase involved in cell wall biosynthesis
MDESGKTVCMISCLHPLMDDRIYWKEAVSLQKSGYQVTHIGVSDCSYDETSEHGIRLISIKRKQFFKNPFADKFYRTISFRPNIYTELFKKASELRADVYHFHDFQINRIGKKLKALPQHPKVIYDVHEPYPEIIEFGNNYKFFLKWIFRIYGRYIYYWQIKCAKKYDLIIATEEIVANSFAKALPKNRVDIIYNYSDLYLNCERTQENIVYDAIYCGGINSFRGVWTALDTAKLAKERNIKIKLLFLGNIKEPKLKDKINKFLNLYSLQDYVIFKGHVPYQNVSDYYKISRCGLVIFENNPIYHILMPIKTFEYLCFGLPIITSDFGHTKEIVNKHQCGTIIKKNSPENMLMAILNYKTKYSFYQTQSENGKAAFENFYKWELMDEKLINLYSLFNL